jgi:uncharacterized protein with PCYCGC motif
MSKSSQGKGKASRRKKKTKIWQLLLAVAVVIGMASSWMFFSGGGSGNQATPEAEEAVQPVVVPGLEDRMVLPAKPQRPRPVTLNPAAFSDQPEVAAAYQAAKDSPETLENVACYCGCFGNAGHRNNLDCYKDSHGVT